MAAIAATQWGVVSIAQLITCGLSTSAIGRWVAIGWLHPIHRGVYAFGNPSVPLEGLLVAALFHAAPSVALSHTTATWWWGLIPHPPELIEVVSLNDAGSSTGVKVRHPRHVEAIRHRRLPVTTIPQTLLDFASQAAPDPLRLALAEADYRGLLNVAAIKAVLGRGKPGSAKLRRALAAHEPKYAWTRSRLERAFLALCRRYGIPLPEVNVYIGDWLVDAVWKNQRVIVELDGYHGHRSHGQLERDHRRDLELRAAGWIVIRYTETQIAQDGVAVARDLLALLSPAGPSGGSGSR